LWSSVGIIVGGAKKKRVKQQEREGERQRRAVDVKVAVREKLRDAWRLRVEDAEKWRVSTQGKGREDEGGECT
jgi:hypothetical protein